MSGRAPNLGELEMAALDHLWAAREGDVKSVHIAVGVDRRISQNTVQSALERLFRKGLLSREKVSHAYLYRPAITRSELLARYIGEAIDSISDGSDDRLLAAFVDLVERTDEETLDRLERAIREKRAEAEGDRAGRRKP